MKVITLLIKPASSLCNMRCKYCFYADVANNRKVKSYGIMTPKTQESMVINALKTAKEVCSFAFQGGEPTLAGLEYYKNLIKLQAKYNVNGVKINNSIQTNGYIIDEQWAEFLGQNHFLVGLSLDGPKEVHDSFRVDAAGNGTFLNIMKTSRLLRKHNVEFNILCVVNNVVALNGKRVYEFFRRNGFNYMQFIPCLEDFDSQQHDYSLSPKMYAKFLKTTFDCFYRDIKRGEQVSVRHIDNYVGMLAGFPPESCGMSGYCTCYYVVESDGSVYPCDFYVLDKYKLGNICSDDLEQLHLVSIAREFVEQSKHMDSKCANCKYLQLCRGGCRRNREPFVDGKPSLNIYCDAFSEFFDYAITRLQELAAAVRRANS